MSEEPAERIRVVDVKNYFFCQQIVYINHVINIKEPDTVSMIYAQELHDGFDLRKVPKHVFPKQIIRGLRLESKNLKLAGMLDTLIITRYDEYIPYEVKLGNPLHNELPIWDKMQLVAYAMLVEDAFDKVVKRGFIYLIERGRAVEVRIVPDLRKKVIEAVDSIHRMMSMEERPLPRRSRYCKGCRYSWVCGPV